MKGYLKAMTSRADRLGCEGIVLNSFIISVTPYREIKWLQDTLKQSELEKMNVLFQKDDKNKYVSKMFDSILPKQLIN